MGTVKVTNIEPIADNGTLTIGNSGDTIALTSGAKTSGFGKIGQVVSTTSNTQASTTANFGSTGVASGVKASITPTSTSSKIFINVTSSVKVDAQGSNSNRIGLVGLKDNTGSTLLYKTRFGAGLSAANKDLYANVAFSHLHSPASTDTREYEITFGRYSGTFNNTVLVNGDNYHSCITLMEILD